VVRAHISKTKINGKTATNVINLLYFDNQYALIKDLSRLLSSQISKQKQKFIYENSLEDISHKS